MCVVTDTAAKMASCTSFVSTPSARGRFRPAHDGRHRRVGGGRGATKVSADLETAFERLVDESQSWQHTSEGDRNPWAHVRAALAGSPATIPLVDGGLALGSLQAIYLCEFDGPRERELRIVVT